MLNFTYNKIFLPAMEIAFKLAVPFSGKARSAVEGRKNWDIRLKDALEKAPSGHRVMLHSTSVGEFLQGRAILDEMLKNHPDIVIILSHFSPSAAKIISAYDRAAARILLPFDTHRNVNRLLDIARPDLLIFSKFDVWPNFATEARRRGISTALIAGTLAPDSGRLFPVVAKLSSEGLKALDFIAAISDDDAERFTKLGVEKGRIETAGDPRFDQTWNRARGVSETDTLFSGLPNKSPTFVAGSTWPADEKVVAPAFAALKAAVPKARLIIAPHEPTKSRVLNLSRKLCQLGLSAATMSEIEANDAEDPDAVIVDRVGVLAKIYRLGSAAFVGGSFVRRVHNTMEPACMSIPVLVGPKHANAREAQLLIKAGGAYRVGNAREMEGRLVELFRDEEACRKAGAAAAQFVKTNLGAAKRTVNLIENRFPGLID